jgi:hypothetical protein
MLYTLICSRLDMVIVSGMVMMGRRVGSSALA